MRLLFVNSLYAPDIGGGAELQLASHVAAARDQGHQVLVATTTGADQASQDQVDGIDVQRMPLRNLYWHHGGARRPGWQRLVWHLRDIANSAMAGQLDAVAERFKPQLMVFHNLAGLSASAWQVAARRGVPGVQVLHDYYHLCPRSQMLHQQRQCQSVCAGCSLLRPGRAGASQALRAVVGVSQAVLDTHRLQGLFAGVPIQRVIHNARQMQAAAPALDAAAGGMAQRFGFIGTLAPWKGIALLLEAFESLRRRLPALPLRLLVAGNGEPGYVADLKARHASEAVEFLGSVTPESFFAKIDVSVVPSLWNDPLPGVVFESLICGVPVIGARRGGIPEMLTTGLNGLLFDPDQPDALTDAMQQLASSPALLAQCRAGTRPSAAPFADTNRVAQAYASVYAAALDGAPVGGS